MLPGPNVGRMFPRLSDLTDIHLRFLHRLRARQRQAPVVECLGDVLLEQFSGHEAARLKAAYGEFCSRHRDAVDIYKYYLGHDRRFQEFVKHCQVLPRVSVVYLIIYRINLLGFLADISSILGILQ